jgi:two-component system, NtrC family, sensor kinase
MSRRVVISGEELAAFLRRDALELSREAGFDPVLELVATDADDAPSAAAALTERLRAGRGSLEILQRMAGLGELGAALLHEVRNVLTGVRGFGQVALARSEGEQRAHLEIIARETDRAIELLSRYLELARSDERRPVPLRSRELIETTAMLVRHRFVLAKVQLVVDAGPDARLVGCKEELQQVLVNLLINALQVSAPGAEVRLGVAASESWLDITVLDRGPGIAPEHMARLFEPFFTTKPPGEGVGLGLAVSRGIVQRHGGTIAIASAPGAGAAFTVRLPLGRDEEEQG